MNMDANRSKVKLIDKVLILDLGFLIQNMNIIVSKGQPHTKNDKNTKI